MQELTVSYRPGSVDIGEIARRSCESRNPETFAIGKSAGFHPSVSHWIPAPYQVRDDVLSPE